MGQATYSTSDLHDFGGTTTNANGSTGPDGQTLNTGTTVDSNGNVFGVTQNGGAYGKGMLWEYTIFGQYLDLYDFGNDSVQAANPKSTVTVDQNGNIFGTTLYGGTYGLGTVWELPAASTFTVLHSFGGTGITRGATNGGTTDAAGPDGTTPSSNVVFDFNGNMFGTTVAGGAFGQGTLWMIDPGSNYSIIHDFGDLRAFNLELNANGSDGVAPQGQIGMDDSGYVNGTTTNGGSLTVGDGSSGGTFWTGINGFYQVLHNFGAAGDGYHPQGLVFLESFGGSLGFTKDSTLADGTPGGGTCWFGYGGASEYFSLEDFSGLAFQHPTGTPAFDPNGFVIGASADSGTIWQNDFNGNSTVILTGTQLPVGSLSTDSYGDIFATTAIGGASGGSLWLLNNTASNFSLQQTSVFGGRNVPATLVLPARATSPTTVTLTSSSPNLIAPATLTVPTGTRTVNFTVSTASGKTAETDNLKATYPGGSKTVSLSIFPVLQSVQLSQSTVSGGGSVTGSVTLAVGVPIDTAYNLSSSRSGLTLPSSVTVPAGQTQVSFTITVPTVDSSAQSRITATAQQGGASVSTLLTIAPPYAASVSFTPSAGPGGANATGTVTLTAPAPAGGLTVSLINRSAILKGPAPVTVPQEATSVTFTAATTVVSADTAATISARTPFGTTDGTYTVQVARLISLVMPHDVIGGYTMTGTVNLNGPIGKDGCVISLASISSFINLPRTVSIQAGASSATFQFSTPVVSSDGGAGTIAEGPGRSLATASIAVHSSAINLNFNASSVSSGGSLTGTVSLAGVAPSSGFTIYLQSSSGAAQVPATITIPAGAASATFTLTTTKVTSSATVSVKARFGASSTSTATFTLNP